MTPLARVAAVVLTIAPVVARAHTVLDAERLQQAVVEIARAEKLARAAPPDVEALYDLGEKVEAIVDLLNQDVAEHGASDVLARLVVERLRTYGVQLRFADSERRYAYDLAAYREYVSRAPDGPRAPAAWFRLLARSFHERSRADASGLAAIAPDDVARAAAEEQRFLDRHPAHERANEVRFFLAVDYYRLAKSGPRAQVPRYRRLGREALQAIVARHPGTMEARAAETLLDDLPAQ